MLIHNQDYHFVFEIPDDYKEIPHEQYEEYNIASNTLHVFVKIRENGTPTSISINLDAEVMDLEDYLSLIDENIDNMIDMGMEIGEHSSIVGKNNKRIDRVYSAFKKLHFVTYFTVVGGSMIAASVEINEVSDEQERELKSLFLSIEEVK